MNNLKKIGLSALAGSLVSFSAGAAEMSVSGGAAIYFDDTNRGKATRGNGFYMGDSLNFSASGETDNGISVTVKYEIDGGTLDDHSIALGGDWGTLTFDGHGASSAMGAVDDMTPNAYEEAWDIIDVLIIKIKICVRCTCAHGAACTCAVTRAPRGASLGSSLAFFPAS